MIGSRNKSLIHHTAPGAAARRRTNTRSWPASSGSRDNGAKWKDLPRRFGAKRTVHRWFTKRTREGIFERILQRAGRLVEQRGGYKLYECFIDATFSKGNAGGDGLGCTKVGKGVKILLLVDVGGLPAAVDLAPANIHESRLVQQRLGFMLPG